VVVCRARGTPVSDVTVSQQRRNNPARRSGAFGARPMSAVNAATSSSKTMSPTINRA
jgi:hypothetical protein